MKTHTSSSPSNLNVSPPEYVNGIWYSDVKRKLCSWPLESGDSSLNPWPSIGKYALLANELMRVTGSKLNEIVESMRMLTPGTSANHCARPLQSASISCVPLPVGERQTGLSFGPSTDSTRPVVAQ